MIPAALSPWDVRQLGTVRRLSVLVVAALAVLTSAAVLPGLVQRSTGPGPAIGRSTPVVHGATAVPSGLRSAVAATAGGAGLRESFADDGGLHASESGDAGLDWSLVPESLSRVGSAGVALHPSTPTVHGAVTMFDLGAITSWYRSGQAGIEQGFTIAKRPAGDGGSVAIALRSSGSLTPVLSDGSLLLRDSNGSPVLRYGSLKVTDATGRVLPAHLGLTSGIVHIVLDDNGAVYPLTVDPFTQQALLLASNGAESDYFGESVAMSGDGLTAIVGADNKTVDSVTVAGAAYVYTYSGGTWTQQQVLEPSVVSQAAFFGRSVALSTNGNTALVSAFGLKVGANFSQGGVYVFTRSGTTWTQQDLLTASNGVMCDSFGSSVSLSGAGTEALIGAFGVGGCSNHVGAAYIFTGSGSSWTQGPELTGGTTTQDEFGSAVALSTDGSTALVGAPFALNFQGKAYLFTGADFGTRTLLSDPADHANDGFGTSVSLSTDGQTALVAAPFYTTGGFGGAAYVYTGPSYTSPIEITDPDSNALGTSSALSADGNVVVLGNNDSATYAAFAFSGPDYSTTTVLKTPTSLVDPIGPYFGSVLGVSSNATTLITAGSGVTVGGNLDQGEAGIYQLQLATPSTTVGYWLAAANGGVKAFGQATVYGSEAGAPLAAPIVGLTGTPDGKGYWLVGADGGVFGFGDARFYGSLGGVHLNAPIVGMVATPPGGGYWLVGADGGVFAFGDARFYGSLGGVHLNAPIVGISATTSGSGYWLVGADGGVFAFGDARFDGSHGASSLSSPIVGIARTSDSGGYWLVGANGGVYPYGDATTHGSLAGTHLNAPVDDVVPTADGGGYVLVAGDGGLFSFGDAPFYGSGIGDFPGSTVIGLAASNQT
ncbi:MAG: FG-GAP repeat protein [Acidimicrobiales bacterium]|jgi:hypothetical protein